MGLPLILAGVSLGVAIYSDNLLISYILLVLTVGFNFALTPVFGRSPLKSLLALQQQPQLLLLTLSRILLA